MTTFKTKNTEAVQGLKSLLEKIPAGQQKNWDNGLIPYFMARLKEWTKAELEGDKKKNEQYANLLINNKIFIELCRLPDAKVPFPQDIAKAFEWVLHAGEQCPENKAQMNNFYFIYRNFKNIMKKIPCQKKK